MNSAKEPLKQPLDFPPEAPVAMRLLACWGDSLASRAITRLTHGPSHVGLVFEFAHVHLREGFWGRHWYFEALFGRGATGPTALVEAVEWADRNPERRLELVKIPAQAEDVAAALERARNLVGVAGYGELQLLAMWAFLRFGRRVRHSPRNMVCSEYVARALGRLYTPPEGHSLDEVTPADLLAWAKGRQGAFPFHLADYDETRKEAL